MNNKPRIDVVLQATGIHGWSASYGWINTLQKQGFLNRSFKPAALWGAEEPYDDDGLFEYLNAPEANIILLLGFDWHSQALHNNLRWQERWNKASIKKIAVLQECYSSEVVQKTPVWKQHMYQALASTLSCVDGLICHHEPDVQLLQEELEISVPTIFLPFGVDTEYFKNQNSFVIRLNKALFRGNAPRYFTENTYKERQLIIDKLSNSENVDLFDTNLNNKNNIFTTTENYIKELNSYRLLLNLPSIAPTLTARPFEIMACGGLLLQNEIVGEKTNKLFNNWQHLVYYDAKNPEDLLEKIDKLISNPELPKQIAENGYQLCQEKHSIKARIEAILKWIDDELTSKDSYSLPSKLIAELQSVTNSVNQLSTNSLKQLEQPIEDSDFKVLVDGVFFQLYQTGIARVWRSLLEEWSNNGFAKYIVVLDRAGSAPKIPGIKYYTIPAYDYNNTDSDREMLQKVCDEEGADVFISTYYTTPLTTPSVFMAHDMIPELFGWNLNHPMWREKHYGIQHASSYITVSENTARDLVKCFPEISPSSVVVAKNGINHQIFLPATQENINQFKIKYGISKPYFILVGAGIGYKNSILFFQAFAQLASKQGFDIVFTGGGGLLEPAFRNYTSGCTVHMLRLSDEELATAYSGAIALVYPSQYEGFGLPVLEAIACGCPVITCPNASIPEVAGEAAIYINDNHVEELANALCEVQKPNLRKTLMDAGLEQAKQFSWSKMAETVSSVLIAASLQPLNLKQNNFIIFPDWSQSEDVLSQELQEIIKALASHSDTQNTTLLIDISCVANEDAELLVSALTMNLLMCEDIDISEELAISLVGELNEIQWQVLLPLLKARIVLQQENKQAVARIQAQELLSYDIDCYISSYLELAPV